MLRSISWGVFLGLLLCWSSPVDGDEEYPEIEVSISGRTVTLTCTGTSFEWQKKTGRNYQPLPHTYRSQPLPLTQEKEVEGQYACVGQGLGSTHVRSVYLKVRVCDNCMELSLGLMAGIIVSDLLVTLGVLLVVYYCSKNPVARFAGGAAGGGTRGRPRGQKTDSPPPVPNPDYEPIRKGQREVYAGLEPSRAF